MGIEATRQNRQYSRQYGYHEIVNNEVLKQYNLTSQQQQQSFKNLISIYNSFGVPTILPILKSQSITNVSKGIYGWKLTFKYLRRTLDDEINEMIKNNKKYSQEQILKAIDCILSALMGFKLKKILHGNLHCSNILIDYNPDSMRNNSNQPIDQNKKIYTIGLPLLLNNNQQQNFIKNKQYEQIYISPHGLMSLSQERDRILNSQKNDVFSLGLVVLRMATFCSIKQLYDYQEFKIRENLLRRKIFQCSQMYSGSFCKILQMLTDLKERSRPDFQQVYNYCSTMSQFEDETNMKQQQNQSKMYEKTELYQLTQNKQKSAQISKSNQKNSKSSEKKIKIKIQSPELLDALFVSKQNQKSWLKFKNRLINKNKQSARLLSNKD